MRARLISGASITFLASSLGQAGDRGTSLEAKTMLQKTAAPYQKVGRKATLAGLSGGKSPFRDCDLYVVCVGPDRKIVSNGSFPGAYNR
jgi:hypothetical protein